MPENYVLLERTELNASAASVTFANIPQTGYTDLKIVGSVRGDTVAEYVNNRITFNGSTSGYSSKLLYGLGSGSGASANNSVTNAIDYSCYGTGSTATANTFGNTEIYIPNYTGSTNKSVSIDAVTENNATTAITALTAGLWSNTAAITSISITPSGGSFLANSTFSLYGIAAFGTTPAIAPKASGGNIIDFDGTYWIHTFLTSGTFTPAVGLTCDYLVVAGGGGGGSHNGGGGGAGGYLTSTNYSVSSGTPIAITVGAGAAAVATPSTKGLNGNNSVFATITATGGGGAGSYSGTAGNSIIDGVAGGSGGGSSMYAVTTAGTPGAASPSGQGNAGGTASLAYGGGGGGGAGAVGGNGNVIFNTGGAGGAGLSSSITGSAVTRAGGGGGADGDGNGGAGGSGGGGAGSGASGAGTNGTVNTGSGGGGAGFATSGAGGSGIVIIRYPAA
jgi:hypothetical protein